MMTWSGATTPASVSPDLATMMEEAAVVAVPVVEAGLAVPATLVGLSGVVGNGGAVGKRAVDVGDGEHSFFVLVHLGGEHSAFVVCGVELAELSAIRSKLSGDG